MRRTVFVTAAIVPALGGKIFRMNGGGGDWLMKGEEDAFFHRRDGAGDGGGSADVSDAGEAADLRRGGAPDLETGDEKTFVFWMNAGAERGELKIAREADDGGVGAAIPEEVEEFGTVITNVQERVAERPHVVAEPNLAGARSVYRMRNPNERGGNFRRFFFARQNDWAEAVVLIVADDMQRRGGNVVALLVAGGDDAGARIDAEEGLAEAVADWRHGFAVGGDFQNLATVAADGGAGLARFADDEAAIGKELHAACELAGLGGLRETIAEHFVAIGFAVVVGVEDFPNAVAIENKDFIVANRETERFVQARGKAAPLNFVEPALESVHEPNISIKCHRRRTAVRKERQICNANISLPRIFRGKGDVLNAISVIG